MSNDGPSLEIFFNGTDVLLHPEDPYPFKWSGSAAVSSLQYVAFYVHSTLQFCNVLVN